MLNSTVPCSLSFTHRHSRHSFPTPAPLPFPSSPPLHTLTCSSSPPSSRRPPQGSRLLFSQRATALLPPTPPPSSSSGFSSEVFLPFSHPGASLSSFILPFLSLSLTPWLSSRSLDRLQHSPAALSPGLWQARRSMHDTQIATGTVLYVDDTSHCEIGACTTWISDDVETPPTSPCQKKMWGPKCEIPSKH